MHGSEMELLRLSGCRVTRVGSNIFCGGAQGGGQEKKEKAKPRGKSDFGRVRSRQELHSQCSGFQWPICREHHRRMALPDCTNGLSPTAVFNFPAKGDLSPLLVQGRGRVEDSTLDCHANKEERRSVPLAPNHISSFLPLDLWQMQSRRDMTSVRWSTKELLRPDGALLPLTSRIKFSPPLVLEAIFLPRHSLS